MADDDVSKKEKFCPKCGADIIMTTAWHGQLEPVSDKCTKCGYQLQKRSFREKLKNVLKWSGT